MNIVLYLKLTKERLVGVEYENCHFHVAVQHVFGLEGVLLVIIMVKVPLT